MNVFPINGWNGRARVNCAPRTVIPEGIGSASGPDPDLPGPDAFELSDERRLELVLLYARPLPPHLKRVAAGRIVEQSMAEDHAGDDIDLTEIGGAS